MREGMYLGRPPIDIRQVGSARLQHSLMRGANLYGAGAGGFHQVPAFPPLQHFRPPASANGDRNVELVELYAQQPSLFKQRLAAQFTPAARARAGLSGRGLAPLVPQVGTDG